MISMKKSVVCIQNGKVVCIKNGKLVCIQNGKLDGKSSILCRYRCLKKTKIFYPKEQRAKLWIQQAIPPARVIDN